MRDAEGHYELLLEVAEALMDGLVAEALMDELAQDDASPYGGLVSLIGDRIRECEARMHPWPDDSTPASALAFLMQHMGYASPICRRPARNR